MRNKLQGETKPMPSYWQSNLKLMGVLLSIWALVSFGFGVFLRPFLDKVSIGGAPLGFWFAQQGSIIVFVILIFVYSHFMKKLDAKYTALGEGENQ